MRPRTPVRAAVALAVSLLATAVRPAGAQQAFSMSPGQIGAGACTGSTGGEGLGAAGGYPTEYFFRTPFVCDVHIGTAAPVHAHAAVGGVAPQVLVADGSADWGALRFSAEEHIQNWQNQGLSFPRAFAQVGFLDNVLIDDPAHHGQQGTLTADLHLTGTLYGHGDQGGAAIEVTLFHHGLIGIEVAHHAAGQEASNVIHTFDEMLHPSFTFTFGTPFDLGLFAYAVTSNRSEGGFNSFPGDALADFAHTLQWAGLTVTAGGQTVTGFSVSTVSGRNWLVGPTATVPEPSSFVLLAGGAVLLGIVARRRRG